MLTYALYLGVIELNNQVYIKILIELQRLESLSKTYKEELRCISKTIRNIIWNDNNSDSLYKLLHVTNDVYELVIKLIDSFDLSLIYEYINILQKLSWFIGFSASESCFDTLRSAVQLENSRKEIERQWQDINSSENGLKSFKEIFDDIFTNCIEKHKDKFFHQLNESDCLCRAVDDKWPINRERFIPRVSLNSNRWNPPGRAFLYLSFSNKNEKYSANLSLNEYICLEECKATKGDVFYFCDFKPITKGMIFDLSYNDTTLGEIKNAVNEHYNDVLSNIVNELLSDSNKIERYKRDKKFLSSEIHKLQHKYEIDRSIIEESYAKQYLKMICSCIYKKVDETDETKRKEAYKSFHALALYLEEKGVAGIIYPCTRTTKIIGKNLVLFNRYDAEPIEGSIRKYKFD